MLREVEITERIEANKKGNKSILINCFESESRKMKIKNKKSKEKLQWMKQLKK
jgi:hypothetical protein